MKHIRHTLLYLLALLCSCEQVTDDYRYPSVVTDYACLATDSKGAPYQLHLDNGCTYPVSYADEYLEAHPQLPTYKADTAYRVISVYELGDDNVASIYSLSKTVSDIPTPLRADEELFQSPVYLQSIWCSGGYLNMVIEVKALNGKHSIGFVDTTPEGLQGKEFTFYHKVINDIESYRQRLYGSIPLTPFKDKLQQGDTLRFVINTYDKGIQRIEFTM